MPHAFGATETPHLRFGPYAAYAVISSFLITAIANNEDFLDGRICEYAFHEGILIVAWMCSALPCMRGLPLASVTLF